MTRTCNTCEQPFDYEPIMMGEVEVYVPFHCDPCIERIRSEREDDGKARIAENRAHKWRQMCPPIYLDTRKDDPRLSRDVRQALDLWDCTSGRFLGLCGATGKGKTRLAFLKLEALHMAGWGVFCVSAKRLERAVQNQWSNDPVTAEEARDLWKSTRNAQILLLDDVGKEKFTERVAGEFYDLVEHRSSHKLSMIWTANLGPRELEQRLGDEHGSATVRRLLEFSDVVIA